MSNSFPCQQEESPEITFIAQQPKKKSRWSLLRNVWKAINLFRYQQAHPITADDICLQIRRIPTDKSYRNRKQSDYANSPYAIALNDLKRQSRFFDCIQRGAQQDIDTIMELIDNDPYKAILGERHPFSFVNKPNNNGQTPLYVAARNGYREIVGLLLEKGADHLLLSGVENQVQTALEVACRWGHMEVVKVLLRNNWPMEYLQRAANCASNLVIKKAILNKPSLVSNQMDSQMGTLKTDLSYMSSLRSMSPPKSPYLEYDSVLGGTSKSIRSRSRSPRKARARQDLTESDPFDYRSQIISQAEQYTQFISKEKMNYKKKQEEIEKIEKTMENSLNKFQEIRARQQKVLQNNITLLNTHFNTQVSEIQRKLLNKVAALKKELEQEIQREKQDYQRRVQQEFKGVLDKAAPVSIRETMKKALNSRPQPIRSRSAARQTPKQGYLHSQRQYEQALLRVSKY